MAIRGLQALSRNSRRARLSGHGPSRVHCPSPGAERGQATTLLLGGVAAILLGVAVLELDLGPPAAYGWLKANARPFGFIHRYAWEDWHYGLA